MSHNHHATTDNARRIFWAMILTGLFMVVEIVGGVISGSLALLADAGHMFTDLGALALAWLAFYISKRPPDPSRSYGYQRFQVLAAFINGVSMVILVGWIIIEAIARFMEPVTIMGKTMLIVAIIGLFVNIISFAMLHRGDKNNINMKGAAIHVLGDMLGSVATIIAAIVILYTGWTPIDPLLSMFVALLIFKSAFDLVKKSAHILLEGSPEWLDVDELRKTLTDGVPEVKDIHHVHAWSLTPEHTMVTLHACLDSSADTAKALVAMKRLLLTKFKIDHSTIQVEPDSCSDEEH